MTAGIIVVLLVAAGSLAFVAAPLLRKDAAEAERADIVTSETTELQSRREMLLASLKDLDDDHETAKIDDADYTELHDRLTLQAVDVMKRLDDIELRGPIAVPRTEPPERQD